MQYIFDRRAPQEKKKSHSRHGALSFPFTGTAKVTSLERSWKTLVELNHSSTETCYWSEFTLLFIVSIFSVLFSFLCNVVQLNDTSTQFFVYNKITLLCCGSSMILPFKDPPQQPMQIIVKLRVDPPPLSTTLICYERFLWFAKLSSLW